MIDMIGTVLLLAMVGLVVWMAKALRDVGKE